MSRAVLAVMAGLLCTLAGAKHANRLRYDANRLKRWTEVLCHLELLLSEATLSIPQALCAAADSHLQPDVLLRTMASAIQAQPLLSLEEAFLHCSQESTEKPTLARLFSRLGHGSKENRCLAVHQAAQELEFLAQGAANKAEKDTKLWQTLGFIGGACLTILLL